MQKEDAVKIDELEGEEESLLVLLTEEYRYHVLRSEALKRELIRRDVDVD